MDVDFDFLNYDPTDAKPHLRNSGYTEQEIDAITKEYFLFWGATDKRQFDRQVWQGWEILPGKTKGNPIRRGDLVLMRMPMDKAQKRRALLTHRQKLREDAPMTRFEHEVAPYTRTRNFSTFDDPSGPKIRR